MMPRTKVSRSSLPLLLLLTACDVDHDELTLAAGDNDDDDELRACTPPAFSINPRRSLFETVEIALTPFDMPSVMTAIAVNAGYAPTPMATYNDVIHNFQAGLPANPGSRCNDDVDALGIGTGLNGYPLECERDERFQDFNMGAWFPIAAVNRIDLMPADGSNCGEQRLVMASNASNRMFLIFEAQIPNPIPGCIDACRPIAEFWHGLSGVANPAIRASELQKAFLTGHPALTSAGIGPFMSADNLTFGSGQIRSNNFDQPPWTLREHKLADEFGALVSVQVPVSGNLYGELWNDTTPWPQGAPCQAGILAGLGDLLTTDINTMAIDTPNLCWAAESREDPSMDYEANLSAGSGLFATDINITVAGLGVGLNANEVARRATYVGSCMGCHEPTLAMPTTNLGGGVVAPNSLGFVHVSETIHETCDTPGDCWLISPALKTAFLPHREASMINYLTTTFCTSCATPPPPPPSTASAAAPWTLDVSSGTANAALTVRVPNIEDEADIAALLEYERALEAGRSDRTISGAPTTRMH